MSVHSPGTVDNAEQCDHSWIFTAPRHIRCTQCPAIGRRNATKAERAEFKRGGWIYLMPAPLHPKQPHKIVWDAVRCRG